VTNTAYKITMNKNSNATLELLTCKKCASKLSIKDLMLDDIELTIVYIEEAYMFPAEVKNE
jgi:hypothetical protein